MLDDLNELVPEAPKVRTVGDRAHADPGVVFGLDAALWRGSEAAARAVSDAESDADLRGHMAAEAECYHVVPGGVPLGWSATRASLEALMKCASADELYRCKGVVPFTLEEATAEAARQGLPAPSAESGEAGTRLGDTWWLFNGVAGRLTLEPLLACAGPASLVFMGQGLKMLVPRIEKALGLPAKSVMSAGTLDAPKPLIKVELGQRLITCGAARGLSAWEPKAPSAPAAEAVREVD